MFYVHENALRTPVGSSRVMHEQLLHLLFLGNRPECAIRVIPVSAGVRGMAAGSFHIFHYKEDPPVVYVQHETTSEFLENEDELASYRNRLNRVATVALDGPESRQVLASMDWVGHAARCLVFQVLFRVASHRTPHAPFNARGSPVTVP